MRRYLAHLLLLTGLIVGPVALAADNLTIATGALMPLSINQRSSLSAPHLAALQADLDGVLERLRQTPALRGRQGFALNQSLTFYDQDGPAGAKGFLLVRRIDPAQSQRDPRSGHWQGIGEGPGITVQFNDVSAFFGYPAGQDAAGDYFQIPVHPRRLQGFPVVEVNGGDVVVIAKPGRKPFVHISRQRYLEGLMASDREQIERLQGMLADTHDAAGRAEVERYLPKWRAELEQKQAMLAAMSATERAAPMCQSGQSLRQLFGDCNAPHAVYLVTANPAYFDPALPRHQPQLLTIDVVGKAFFNDHLLGRLVRQAVAQLDLKALHAELH